jgi:sugar/nucleoside kinase (ribokinase family)
MGSGKRFKVAGTGCALVDYLYSPIDFSSPIFNNYIAQSPGDGGLSPGKLVFTEEFEKFSGKSYQQLRQSITGGKEPIGINIGGPSMVSLIHAAQLLYDLNADIYFSGCKSDDDAGHYIEEKLKQTPLKISRYKTSDNFTPFTDVLSDPAWDRGHGERIFINNIGAAWDFHPGDLSDDFFNCDMVVFGGTALVPKIHQELTTLLKKAKQKGAITIVNTVYDFLSEKTDPFRTWPLGKNNDAWPWIDLVISDKEEALRYSGARSIDDALLMFREKGVKAAAITNGPNPVSFFAQDSPWEKTELSQMNVSEKARVQILQQPETIGDTTGCGDNFTGGMLASIVRQKITKPLKPLSMQDAVKLGIASGGFACFYHGGTWFESKPGEKVDLVRMYF